MTGESAYRILILGGYGNFGLRIARALATHPQCHLILAGRDRTRAQRAAEELTANGALAQVEAIRLDADDRGLAECLREMNVATLIHTAGPFQGQSYSVANACIDVGVHYIDLADGRAFVAGITSLQDRAREKGVLIVSGASTVPALSAAVIDHYRSAFASISNIAIGITPGNRTPRGLSTVESVLSYCGKAYQRWQQGAWRSVYGWQDLHRVRYPKIGKRWFANCDVPDLTLFPERYAVTDSVKFHAGLELSIIQLSMWMMSWLARWGVVRNWMPAAHFLKRASEYLMNFGTDAGGMHVEISGIDHAGQQRRVFWVLTAMQGHGPQIPCIASIVIVRKLMSGRLNDVSGARPCVDLMTLEEFDEAVQGLDIAWEERWS
jgi:Saccharopine dehydrogenase NADP binding domain